LIEVKLQTGSTVRPGELVVMPVDGEITTIVVVGRVVEGHEFNEYARPGHLQVRDAFGMPSAPRLGEDLIRRYVTVAVEPLEELIFNADFKELQVSKIEPGAVFDGIRDPQTLIPAESPVYRCPPDFAAPVLGLLTPPSKDGGGADNGLHIGRLLGGEEIPVILGAQQVLPRHILIVGTTGSGKSYLRGVLAEEIHMLGIPQVNIDVHGEMVSCVSSKQLQGYGRNVIPGEDLTVKISSLTESEILEMIPNLTENQEEIVRRAFLALKRRQKAEGLDFELEELISEIKAVGSRLGGKSSEATKKSSVTVDLAVARTEALAYERILGKGINWAEALRSGALINIDCRRLSLTEMRIVVGAVARELLTLRMRRKIPPLVFSLDEAHLFLPPLREEDTPSARVVRELIRFGRHYSICMILITQSPLDIDRKTIRQTNTRFIFAIDEEQLGALQGVFADAPEDIIRRLPKMEQGTCLLTGSLETVRHAVSIRVRERYTPHGGETPDVVGEVRALGWDRKKAMTRLTQPDDGKA